MKLDNNFSSNYRMPAEFHRHKGTIMIWPIRPGSWPDRAKAKKIFIKIARLIAEHEKLYMICDQSHKNECEEYLYNDADKIVQDNLKIVVANTNDAWARDTSPIFVKQNKEKNNTLPEICGINFTFNAWGGEYDGLYADWADDDKLAIKLCDSLGYDYFDAAPFVLEGGSIHTDGKGTLIATESCLLSPGRNPDLNKKDIEDVLKKYLGIKKVIWIPYGIYNDETNEHVDNVCAFTSEENVVLAWTDDENDPQYEMSMANLKVLQSATDCDGKPIKVHKLLIPNKPVVIQQDDLEGYEFEDGEDIRELGERLAASYVNFYIANDIVLVPQFEDINDIKALGLIQELIPDKEVIGIYARDIIVGGGNIHCITMQIPD